MRFLVVTLIVCLLAVADPLPAQAAAPSESATMAVAAATCQGVNSYNSYWWGWFGQFDSCLVQKVIQYFDGYATTVELTQVICVRFPAACYILTPAFTLLKFNAWLLRGAARYGTGVRIWWNWGAAVPWLVTRQ